MSNYFAVAMAVLALVFAFAMTSFVKRQAAGNDRMKELAAAIHGGAKAFLFAEYRVLVVFIAVLFLCIGIGLQSWATAIAYVCGSLASVLAGYLGMDVATNANVRTANAAMESGKAKALQIAFRGGSVMGMCVVGLGLLGCALVWIITGDENVLMGFSLGASSIALFARVGGGIYPKAADVGADLVGKVEAGIPEDDPRNPAVIADNVGDNVGDVAGMGADLFESYVGAIVSAVTLGILEAQATGASFPLVLAGIGILASIIGSMFVKGGEDKNPATALNMGSYFSAVVVIVASLVLSNMFFGNIALVYAWSRNGISTAYSFTDDIINYVLLPRTADQRTWQVSQSASKGFFLWNSKISESVSIGTTKGDYYVGDAVHEGRSDYLQASLSYTAEFAKWISFGTENSYSLSRPYTDGQAGGVTYHTFSSTASLGIWPVRQLRIAPSVQYYFNNYYDDGRHNVFLDCSLEYYWGRAVIFLRCANLLDNDTFRRVTDNGITRYSSEYRLRGRTLMLGLRIKII